MATLATTTPATVWKSDDKVVFRIFFIYFSYSQCRLIGNFTNNYSPSTGPKSIMEIFLTWLITRPDFLKGHKPLIAGQSFLVLL